MLWGLALLALGVVYGDIGTSPLYALRECFHGDHPHVDPTPENVLGVLSLVSWSLILVISFKYLGCIMAANNRGEGGILALLALLAPDGKGESSRRKFLIALGLFGAALLYGDGMITPAISVLSAVEGLSVATPAFDEYIVPITIAILVGLFLLQRSGTSRIGSVFGPIMVLWFVTIALLGIASILKTPTVLTAINPTHAVNFFLENDLTGFLVLGTVFLVVTGGEALYADMGHFGAKPIRVAWFGLVLWALLLNYYGQGALILRDSQAAENPFYRMAPGWSLYPMVALATAATVIASQALISGVFSLTMQAVQLGYCPRVRIEHTSESQFGQIFIPFVNWALMFCTIGLVIGFGSSSNLAAAYGIAVTATMAITTILYFAVSRRLWNRPLLYAVSLSGFFLIFDFAFFGANMVKIPHGGWFPLVMAAMIFIIMTTWKRGRAIVGTKIAPTIRPIESFLTAIAYDPPQRVAGTAVFMTGSTRGIPMALLHNLRHNKVVHKRVVLLSVLTTETPFVDDENRIAVENLGDDFHRIIALHGFMEEPNVPALLPLIEAKGLKIKLAEATFFLGRETLIINKRGLRAWRDTLFSFLARNAQPASGYFRIPPNRVIEVGVQVEL